MSNSSDSRIIAAVALIMGVVFISLCVTITHSLFQPVDVEHPSGPILAILYVPPFGALGGLLVAYGLSITVLSDRHVLATALSYPLGGAAGVLPSVYYMMAFADRRYPNELAAHTDWLLVGLVLGLIPALYVSHRWEQPH